MIDQLQTAIYPFLSPLSNGLLFSRVYASNFPLLSQSFSPLCRVQCRRFASILSVGIPSPRYGGRVGAFGTVTSLTFVTVAGPADWVAGTSFDLRFLLIWCPQCSSMRSIYEEGRFCETFHKYDSGWRSCEACGKRVHCGCIVSVHAFVVLDSGGVECSMCSRKNSILISNPMWPPRPLTGWATSGAIKNCDQAAGSGSSGCWPQIDILNGSVNFSDMKSAGVDKLFGYDESARRLSEGYGAQNLSFSDGSLKHSRKGMFECGKAGSQIQVDNQKRDSVSQTQQLYNPDVVGQRHSGKSDNGVDSSHQPQLVNGKLADVRAPKELLPHYWPKISNEVLHHISGGSNSVITPLFEKTLSASDTGRIGRLVLPKKCAEAYFPTIYQPEGLPLKIEDINGKEWIFQFRFWPNNNSRMYVLEGITNCIQSLQLRAGDVVTFSRIEPEGKLIMGFRKSSTCTQPEQGSRVAKAAVNEMHPGGGDIGDQKLKISEDLTNFLLNGYQKSSCHSLRDQLNTMDMASVLPRTSKLGYIVDEAVGASSSIPCKRKNGTLCSKSKCLKVNNVDLLEVMVTLEEAQGLFREPVDHASNVVIIEDFMFEEYEDAPVIGRPTVIAKGSMGEDIQWAQCDHCLKWRKLPFDFPLPARWTCSLNVWDSNRSSCDAAQELTSEKLKDIFSIGSSATTGKLQDADLCNSIIKESENKQDLIQLTSKHPRYGPSYSPFVCDHSSSEKEPKNQLGKDVSTREHNMQGNGKSLEKLGPEIEILHNGIPRYVNGPQKVICNPMKRKIDLNIQPDREDDASLCCELISAIRMTT